MRKAIYKTREEMPMYLTVMDVADLLGISRASAYELVHEENFRDSRWQSEQSCGIVLN